jgi:microsomal dipeptidase-like Zn-dependent dipeptidase
VTLRIRSFCLSFCVVLLLSGSRYAYAASPTITSVMSSSGSVSAALPGASISIHGSGFGATQGSNYVGFCSSTSSCYTSSGGQIMFAPASGGNVAWSDTQISILVPYPNEIPYGTYLITVFLWDGKISDHVTAQSNGFSFTIQQPPPSLNVLTGGVHGGGSNPYSAVPGAIMNIYGDWLDNFVGCNSAGTVVLQQGQSAPISSNNYRFVGTLGSVSHNGELAFALPGTIPAGTYSFYLEDGAHRKSNSVTMVISGSGGGGTTYRVGAPSIVSISPNPPWVQPEDEITISGGNFTGPATFVSTSGSGPPIVLGQSSSGALTSQIFLEFPSSFPPGSYTVTVPGACNQVSNAYPLTVSARPIPQIASLSPSAGVYPGNAVTIIGTNFGQQSNSYVTLEANGTRWGTTGAPFINPAVGTLSIQSWSQNQIQVLIPDNPASLGTSATLTVTSAEESSNPGTLGLNIPLWGFADLHTHPASHLAFGSDSNGNNGLFWGHPADDGAMSMLTLAEDLPQCAAFWPIGVTHNGGSIDPVQLVTDNQIVSQLNATVKIPFNDQQDGFNNGSGDFSSWPSSISVDHQQMDITSIHRAFQGGLRLLVTSVTNDELLSDLWNQKFNMNGSLPPVHDQNFDYESALTQLSYIQSLVQANSWMEIVTTPSQARQAITSGKLAVVLSLEMDSLQLWQVIDLVQNHQVRHVIPVHLVDNFFGGTAVYDDEFNGLSNWINGSPYAPTSDANVNFQLGTLATLEPAPGSFFTALSIAAPILLPPTSIPLCWEDVVTTILFFAPTPCPVAPGEYGWQPSSSTSATPASPGAVNSKHLNMGAFQTLMNLQCSGSPCGLLLDIAHMGENSAGDALALAQTNSYPVMDSHTGLRCDGLEAPNPLSSMSCKSKTYSGLMLAIPSGEVTVNERSLPLSQLMTIKRLGGVIGLGEVSGGENSGVSDPDPVGSWTKNYMLANEFMGGRSVALGTDTDGLSPLIQNDNFMVSNNACPTNGPTNPYSITVASQFGAPSSGPSAQALGEFSLGSQFFDFQCVGIATYGLLPDFIQAASDVNRQSLPGPPTAAIQSLFFTAEDTIEMWEKVVAAESNPPAPGDPPLIAARAQGIATTNPKPTPTKPTPTKPTPTKPTPKSCAVYATSPSSNFDGHISTAPSLGHAVKFTTTVLDQDGLPVTGAYTVTYTGNVPHPTPRLLRSTDTLAPFSPTIPDTYLLQASISTNPVITCATSVSIASSLSSVASSINNSAPDLIPLANMDGSTVLTLSGKGFSTVSRVVIGQQAITVSSTSDSTVQVHAPAYSGPLPGTVEIRAVSRGGAKSRARYIQYFRPNAPVVTAYSNQTCGGQNRFVIEAYTIDASGNFSTNLSAKLSVGKISKIVKINSPGVAIYTGLWTALEPSGDSTYSGTVTIQNMSAAFTLNQPAAPPSTACGATSQGRMQLGTLAGNGSLFKYPSGLCYTCSAQQLPADLAQARYQIDDLYVLGALSVPSIMNGNFVSTGGVSRAEFLYSLRRVLAPNLAVRVPILNNSDGTYGAPITRIEAATVVTALLGMNEPTNTAAVASDTLVKAGFLHAIHGGSAPNAVLTRAEMVGLLWNTARSEMSELVPAGQ